MYCIFVIETIVHVFLWQYELMDFIWFFFYHDNFHHSRFLLSSY